MTVFMAYSATSRPWTKVRGCTRLQSSIENGFVHLPEKAEWLPEYLHELTTFPTASTTIRLIPPPRPWTGSVRAIGVPEWESSTTIKTNTRSW